MINASTLLTDLKRRLTLLEDDLRARIAELPVLKSALQQEWTDACAADRTAETVDHWTDQIITQAGVHWLLSCVFLRFIEDNGLVDRPWISGTPASGRLNLARDNHEAYFRLHPLESDRDYLLACFREAGALPGLHTFFDETHNPVFRLGLSGNAAMALRELWQQQDPNTGELRYDFTDPDWNTRFLGDLYQDLSEATRKRYALLQTPEFVEEFILDRTLTPAIREFGYRTVRMIDPTCGSGHFLLGGFQRMVYEWSRAEPTRNRRDVAQKALDAVAGVDLNPFAVAISRFRLLVAALQVSEVRRLADAPDFRVSVAIGDSLLHGRRFGMKGTDEMFNPTEYGANAGLIHAYASEDLAEVQRILGQQYHAVVGNPPYIVVRDAVLNAAYRRQYTSCHMKYSLGAPFTERFFELALTGQDNQGAGFVGLITANSFMKREFGSKLIEQVLPRLDLTHVVDTSGAYIPGHGTPTVILFGRHRGPVDDVVRTAMGIKREPSTPDDPAHGLVWSAILGQIDQAGSESEFVSVADTGREVFAKHPWSIGGGGAADLKEIIEEGSNRFGNVTESIGFASFTGSDDVFAAEESYFLRKGFPKNLIRPFVVGDTVRDYQFGGVECAFAPYDEELRAIGLEKNSGWGQSLWSWRSTLEGVISFAGKTRKECGDQWWTWYRWIAAKYRTPLTITFGEIATHNHFILDRGGKVFNRTAPVVKLSSESSEDVHLGLLGLLNSSVACFWLKQVCFPKDGQGLMWDERFAFNSTNIAEFPIVDDYPISTARKIDSLTATLRALSPSALLEKTNTAVQSLPTRSSLGITHSKFIRVFQQMVAEQEELDWQCYRLYGLLPAGSNPSDYEFQAPPDVALGERAFEIVLARRVAAGKTETNWFQRHKSTPITEIPNRWPEDYKLVVQRRIEIIETTSSIKIIEQSLYKRRWNATPWAEQEQSALRDWLLARLESPPYWITSAGQPAQLTSTSRLADAARQDADFMQIAELYAGHADFDAGQLVAALVTSEAVPFLPVLRYADTGLRKRALWEATWDLQRREDAGESVGNIPVPPKYQNKDFLKADVWRLRGGLDVPKERWVSYPGCERGADGSLVIAWAGWDHLQQATALAAFYLDMKDSEGWPAERLQPLLAGLLELLPWLVQWHNELDPVYGERMGDYYTGFVAEEARAQGCTLDDLKACKPVVAAAPRKRRKAAT